MLSLRCSSLTYQVGDALNLVEISLIAELVHRVCGIGVILVNQGLVDRVFALLLRDVLL